MPLYLKISDVEPIGGMYITEWSQKKDETQKLSAIIYPVYNLKKGFQNVEEFKKSPCNIVVKDSHVNEKSLEMYFIEKKIIEGKFDQKLIGEETRKLLVDNGYNITKNCIVITKGAKFWSTTTCILVILGCGFVGLIILLSLLPSSLLHKIFRQEERFVRL